MISTYPLITHSVSMSLVQGGEGTAPEECGEKDRERRRKVSTAGIGEGKWSKEGRRLRAGLLAWMMSDAGREMGMEFLDRVMRKRKEYVL